MIYSLFLILLSITTFLYKNRCHIIGFGQKAVNHKDKSNNKSKLFKHLFIFGFLELFSNQNHKLAMDKFGKDLEKFIRDMGNFRKDMGKIGRNMERFVASLHVSNVEYSEVKKEPKPSTSAEPASSSSASSSSYSSYFQSLKGENFHEAFATFSVNGYIIRTKGLHVSFLTRKGVMKITITISGSVVHKVNGQEIEIKMMCGSNVKYAYIKIPARVKMEQLKIEETSDVIQITGPSGLDVGFSRFCPGSSFYPA